MLLVPLVVSSKLMTGSDLLMTSYLKFVQVGQVTLRAHVGEEVRCVAESWLRWTDAAVEQCYCHWEGFLEDDQGELGSNN
jgi:hypothetical protein